MSIPGALIRAVREHRIVPLVGAGVSIGVGRGLFPSWKQLMEALTARLEDEAYGDVARTVGMRIELGDYVRAAELGLQALGPYRFNQFLRERFRLPRPDELDLAVPEGIWRLRPGLVITTNYDAVMRWSCPRPNLQEIGNDQAEELALLDEASSEWPWLWYLHGTIERLKTLILAGSDYQRLYAPGHGDAPGQQHDNRSDRYERAIFELNKTLATRPFLYVGFSLSDPYVLQQIEHVLRVTKGKGTPSFALMKAGQSNRDVLWREFNIQLVEYRDHGQPLVDMLGAITEAAFGPAAPATAVRPPARVAAPDKAVVAPVEGKEPLAFEELFASMELTPATPQRPARPSPPARPKPVAGTPGAYGAIAPSDSGAGGRARPTSPVSSSMTKSLVGPAEPAPAPRPRDTPVHAPGRGEVDAGDDLDVLAADDAAGEGPIADPAQLPRKEVVRRPGLEEQYVDIVRRDRRLLVLSPRRGGARTLAKLMALRFGPQVTWLAPPDVPSCTAAEYFAALSGVAAIDSDTALESWILARAGRGGGEHLVVLRHDGGPRDHLTVLGNMLRRLLAHSSICVLVAGETKAAELRLKADTLSLYSGAPVRHVPPLALHEVAAMLDMAGLDGTCFAPMVHRASGGLPGLVVAAAGALATHRSMGADAAMAAALDEQLCESTPVRGVVLGRLGADDRDGMVPRRHARGVLQALLSGRAVRRLEDVEDDLGYAEVRLYYDGVVVADAGGATVFRCPAMRMAAERALPLESVPK